VELYLPAVIVAFLITVLELTEVVAIVFAVSADQVSMRPVAEGALSGVALVSVLAIVFGAAVAAYPHAYLLWASAVVLAAFGVFLFRSTLRSYRRAAAAAAGATPPPAHAALLQFGGGFSAGAVETTEAAIVLLALTAAGFGYSALVGAVAGGIVLAAAASLVRERIRKVKVPWLKLAGTSLLFTFAIFWSGEAAGVAWPGGDLILVPLVVVIAFGVRGVVFLGTRSAGPTAAGSS
jgi:Ca2+/H+ antiporter, TMEM165/GDT1 family